MGQVFLGFEGALVDLPVYFPDQDHGFGEGEGLTVFVGPVAVKFTFPLNPEVAGIITAIRGGAGVAAVVAVSAKEGTPFHGLTEDLQRKTHLPCLSGWRMG